MKQLDFHGLVDAAGDVIGVFDPEQRYVCVNAAHDNFFDLGGHSLLMAQVHRRLREELKVELPLVKLLEPPTISALAQYLGSAEDRGQAMSTFGLSAQEQGAGS